MIDLSFTPSSPSEPRVVRIEDVLYYDERCAEYVQRSTAFLSDGTVRQAEARTRDAPLRRHPLWHSVSPTGSGW